MFVELFGVNEGFHLTTNSGYGQPEGCPTKTHHNWRTPATKKHAVRVLGRFGTNGVVFPALDFASVRRMLDQDSGGGNGAYWVFNFRKY